MPVALRKFEPDQKVLAQQNGVFRPGTVEQIELRVNEASKKEEWAYYVHWNEFDRRLDEWVTEERLRNMESLGRTSTASKAPKVAKVMPARAMNLRSDNAQGSYESWLAAASSEPPGSSHTTSIPAKANFLGRPTTRTSNAESHFFYRPKNINVIYFGQYEVEAWYFSPYLMTRPTVRTNLEESVEKAIVTTSTQLTIRSSPVQPEMKRGTSKLTTDLHVCPFCLQSFLFNEDVERHLTWCTRHPSGREIYRDVQSKVIVFEVDGKEERCFCENIALISKMFLEHKNVDYDMSVFVFYVLCFIEPQGCMVAAYFSKEKHSPEQFNLSCILSLPQHQGKGLGRFLVEMSYEMTKREGHQGTPEKPLSDLGEKLYRSFWRDTLLECLCYLSFALENRRDFNIDYLMRVTGMSEGDIKNTFKLLGTSLQSIHITEEMRRVHQQRKIQRMRSSICFVPSLLRYQPQQYDLCTARLPDPRACVAVPIAGEKQISIGKKRPRQYP